jgi:hypothetical protein
LSRKGKGSSTKRDQNLRTRYGIGLREYDKLLAYQTGVCAICGGPPGTEDGVFRVDHDHQTGAIRGLLCKDCNTALGQLKDRPEIADRARLYLETHRPVPTLPQSPLDNPLGPVALTTEHPRGEEEAKDPRIPTPEVIAALKGHGMTLQEISDEFDLTLAQTKRLYTESERSNRSELARDWLFKNALPAALKTIGEAVMNGDAKTSLAIVKGLGALRETAVEAPQSSGTRTFEEWRASIVKRTITEVGPPVDSTVIDVVATPAAGSLPAHQPTGSAPAVDGSRDVQPLPTGERPEAAPAPGFSSFRRV